MGSVTDLSHHLCHHWQSWSCQDFDYRWNQGVCWICVAKRLRSSQSEPYIKQKWTIHKSGDCSSHWFPRKVNWWNLVFLYTANFINQRFNIYRVTEGDILLVFTKLFIMTLKDITTKVEKIWCCNGQQQSSIKGRHSPLLCPSTSFLRSLKATWYGNCEHHNIVINYELFSVIIWILINQ